MTAASLEAVSVDLSGLLKVVGEHLYSRPEVVLRELVQNAHDSCTRRRLEGDDFAPQIEVEGDPNTTTLSVRDNGAGLTRQEISGELATIGTGGTRKLRASSSSEELIGEFGLGFLSSYTVASRVEVVTTSRQSPEETWRFTSRDGQRFSVAAAEPREVGTTVTLRLKPEFSRLHDQAFLRALLARYCCLLRIPILAPEVVNDTAPPWRVEDSVPVFRKRKLQLDFAAYFEPTFRPITAFPVVSNEDVDVRGVLWIQDGASYGTSDNRNVNLFVRGMLISDSLRDLLPAWAGFVGAVVEVHNLKPTASREDVQRDAAFQRLATHLRETLIQGLQRIAEHEPENWRRITRRHNEALLGASLTDPRLFQLLHQALTVPTSEGDLTLPTIRRRTDNTFIVSGREQAGHRHVWFRAMGKPVIQGRRYGALAFVRSYVDRVGGRLVELGSDGDDALLERVSLDEEARGCLARHFERKDLAVVAARFQPPELPVLVVPDEQALLKQRLDSDEAERRIAQGVLRMARMHTETLEAGPLRRMYVNMNAPVIQEILAAGPKATAGAALLRAFGELLGSDASEAGDLSAALSEFSAALKQLLQEATE